jgi:predicted amidohydrolase YtcJ
MKLGNFRAVIAKSSTVCCALFFCFSSILADTTLLTNVNGYTLDENRDLKRFNAIQFTGDKIDRTFIDENESLDFAQYDEVIDINNQLLIPGLIDSHGHILSFGLSLLRTDLVGALSEGESAQRVEEFASKNRALNWIQGRGWNQVLWDSNEFPSAKSLDEITTTKPIWLTRIDGHAGWANSAAIEIAGVTEFTEDPEGGQIIRDPSGKPTGVFIDNAMNLIRQHIPSLTLQEQKLALQTAMLELATYGLTSVHDAGVSSTTIRAYKELAKVGPLPIRVNVMIAATDEFYEDRLAEGKFRDEHDTLTINSVKIAADGALGSRGAALIDDYSDLHGHTGLLLHSQERMQYFMRAGMNAGFQINTHAIGDNANMLVLDNYEQLISETNSRNLRHRIEHAQILRYEDISRFASLGVIPAMQATHATSDKNMAMDRLGETRIEGAYAWRKLLESGARIANGSDFPVESPNPFFGLHASVTRQDRKNQPDNGWFPEERLSIDEALASFTVDAAYAGHQERILGTLEPGKKADFIVVDLDIFSGPDTRIWEAKPLQTWVNGVQIFNQEP